MNAKHSAISRSWTPTPLVTRIAALLRQLREALEDVPIEPVRLEQSDIDVDLGYGRD